jgi:hypothetical protein
VPEMSLASHPSLGRNAAAGAVLILLNKARWSLASFGSTIDSGEPVMITVNRTRVRCVVSRPNRVNFAVMHNSVLTRMVVRPHPGGRETGVCYATTTQFLWEPREAMRSLMGSGQEEAIAGRPAPTTHFACDRAFVDQLIATQTRA